MLRKQKYFRLWHCIRIEVCVCLCVCVCVHNHLFAHRYERRTSSALKSTSPPPPHHLNTTQQRNPHFLYLSAHNDHNNFIDHVLCLCVCIQGSSPQKKSIDEHLNRNVILMKSVETSCKSCMCLQQWLRTMSQDASLSLSLSLSSQS